MLSDWQPGKLAVGVQLHDRKVAWGMMGSCFTATWWYRVWKCLSTAPLSCDVSKTCSAACFHCHRLVRSLFQLLVDLCNGCCCCCSRIMLWDNVCCSLTVPVLCQGQNKIQCSLWERCLFNPSGYSYHTDLICASKRLRTSIFLFQLHWQLGSNVRSFVSVLKRHCWSPVKKIGHRAGCLHYQPEWLEELDYLHDTEGALCSACLRNNSCLCMQILPAGQLKPEIN